MKGIDLKKFLAGRGFSVSKVAALLNESKQNMSAALLKDDIKTGLVERISEATGIPLLEFYGGQPSEPGSILGDVNVVNNGHDQTTVDPQLVTLLVRQQVQLEELIRMMKADREKFEDLAKK